jgi:AraC family transcriptional regulator, regulatory protein of adaptative response / DNA-3-methyladenine glycosylase II
MSGFSAVVTTGIYCRPGCSARPNPSNVRHYELPAAAEAAGFRACMRCRPYREPAPLSGISSELVCRGIRLVVEGGLDDGNSEDAVAARLGLSARHLRRLFQEEVGVTPVQLARSSRAHFARRLLDDTDLPVTEIAFASGFGSLRQFNRTIHQIFRASPHELRARRRSADRLVADGGLPLRLSFDGPLDWDTTLTYMAARAITGVEHVSDGIYRRTVVIDGDPGAIEVMPAGPGQLRLVAHLPHWHGLIHVVQQVRHLFSLDADLCAATEALGGDPLLGASIRSRGGLRVPGVWDPFEVGVRVIIGQQVSVAGATTIAGRLIERVGTPVPGLAQFGLTHVFPTPATLATADLSGIGLTGARITAIHSFAEAVATGALRLDRSLPLEELVAATVAVRGLGPWTAHYLALRMGEPDAFPAGDLGLRRGLERLTGTSITPRELESVAERWRPWRAQAAVHLWRSQ